MKSRLLFWIFFFSLFFFVTAAQGQEIKDLSNFKLINRAEDALANSDFSTAIKCYEEYLLRRPTSSRVGFELASVYSKIRDYENAMRWYKLLYEQNVNRNILALLSFGRAAMASGDVNLAKRSFLRFKREFEPGKNQKHIKKLNNFHLDGVSYFEKEFDSLMVAYQPNFELKEVYNHPFDLGNKITFLGKSGETNLGDSQNVMLDILNKNEKKIPMSFFSPDGKYFYFSKYGKSDKGDFIASLYQCTKEDGSWESCNKLPSPLNLDEFNSILPTVAKNSKNGEFVIYFVSDRPGGKGKWDIWYTEFNTRKGGFREPKNLGSKVNTAGNEFSPYYDVDDGVLYFSSDGWPGFGSYDIFWIKGEGRSWEDYFNLGTEINTNFDEYYFTRFNNAFFWASNRNEDALSQHYYDEFFKTTFLTRIRKESLAERQKKKEEVPAVINEKDTVHEKEEIEITSTDDGNKFNIEEVSDSIIKVTLYHEFDEADLVDEFLEIIDNYIVRNAKDPELKKIRIVSHTDNFGTEAYNKVLSTNRAKNVNDYLISKGISQTIISYNGKGESEPAVANEKPDGTDNPDGRRLNRRTIIEAYKK